MTRDIRVKSEAEAITVEGRIAGMDLAPVLNVVGAMGVSYGQRAFQLSKFGDTRWPDQYPFSPEPFVHVAGAVTDLEQGPNVKARRLKRIKPGRDTGTLQASLSHEIVGPATVEVGSSYEYAATFCFGGVTTRPISDTIRKNLAKWLKSSKGRKYRPRLGFLFRADTLRTNVNARPFVGMTEELREDMIKTVERVIAERAAGDGNT